MKKLLSVAMAASILLGGGAVSAFAQDKVNSTPDSQKQQTQGMPAGTTPTQYGAKQQSANGPTGLPSYFMRSDGLMFNGLLPAQAWQG